MAEIKGIVESEMNKRCFKSNFMLLIDTGATV